MRRHHLLDFRPTALRGQYFGVSVSIIGSVGQGVDEGVEIRDEFFGGAAFFSCWGGFGLRVRMSGALDQAGEEGGVFREEFCALEGGFGDAVGGSVGG